MCVDIKDIDEGSNVESTGEGEQVDSDYISRLIAVSYTHLTLPTNREV